VVRGLEVRGKRGKVKRKKTKKIKKEPFNYSTISLFNQVESSCAL